MGSLNKFFQFCRFGFGIWVTPMCTMVWVVLRAIYIYVQFVLSIEIELPQTVFMAPRIAVKALDNTSA